MVTVTGIVMIVTVLARVIGKAVVIVIAVVMVNVDSMVVTVKM